MSEDSPAQTPSAAGSEAGDADWLLLELGGKHRAQVLSTLAALGVIDALRDGCDGRPAAVADRLGCDAEDLASLMRAGAGLGVLREPGPGVFVPTKRGLQLGSDQLGSFAAFLGSPAQWQPWARLRDAVRWRGEGSTGCGSKAKPAFEHTFGCTLYEHLAHDPVAAAEYDAAIDAFTRHEAKQLQVCEELVQRLADCGQLVDVGGGRGTLLRELLPMCRPNARGVLLDLRHVVERVRPSLPDNVSALAGDFLCDVPAGGDAYLIKHVLHNWTDEQAVRILRHCQRRKAENGFVVVIDAVLAPDNRPDLARMLDLEMRVLCGGRERRKPELRRMFAEAGLTLQSFQRLPGQAGSGVFVLS